MYPPESGRARTRDVVAAVTLWVPTAAILATWALWQSELPADLPRQWNSSGVSTTWPTWVAITLVILVASGSALVGAFALQHDAVARRRKTFLWSGFAAGMAAGAWLLVAGSTITSAVATDPEVGAWPVALMASMAYGLIPFLIANRWIDPEQTPDY